MTDKHVPMSNGKIFFENDAKNEQQEFDVDFIELLASVIMEVHVLQEDRDYVNCHYKIKKYLERVLEARISDISVISYPDLHEYIEKTNIGTTELYLALAKAFELEADIHIAEKSESGSIRVYLISLSFYIDTLLSDSDLLPENYEEKINALVDIIGLYEMTDWSLFRLFKFYEITNHFGKAEDLLFELLSMASLMETKSIDHIDNKPKIKMSRVEIITEGVAFYNRLLMKSAVELAAGNLPMDEVLDGLNQVMKLKDLYEKLEIKKKQEDLIAFLKS